jgi:pimeloyl-[acyl-carrier protein] methyl ester esterase
MLTFKDKMSLYVESFGEPSRQNLVLLHGWAMHSGVWKGVRDSLARKFRVHLVDLPGHGFSPPGKWAISDWQENPSRSALDAIAEVLPSNCILCGWSLGGQLAIELSAREQARIEKLVLVSTAPCFVKREDWQWGMDASMLQLFGRNLKRDYSTTMRRFLTLQVSGGTDATRMLSQLRRSLVERNEPDRTALEAGLQMLLGSDLRDELEHIRRPVLLLHGNRDVITHPNAARWMNDRLRCSELKMLPECGHAPFLSCPEQFVSNIVRFAGE